MSDEKTSAIDWDGFAAQERQKAPFDHAIMPKFVRPEALPGILADFPKITSGGSYPLDQVRGGPRFDALLVELQSKTMRDHFARLFAIDVTDKPMTITVRGHTREKDGKIHTDSKDKLITVLLYLNEGWDADGGRLRLLNGPGDLDDYAVEAPPAGGTLVAFRNGPTAYHGHKPFVGPRQSIQLNWVTGARAVSKSRFRHRLSAWIKGLKAAS